jgi:hypothetical protein
MYDKILKRIQEKVRTREYVMTLHAEEEMAADGLTIYDVEQGLLSGKIVEKQKDSKTGESKYLLRGQTPTGEFLGLVTKMSITGKLVIITVYID